MLPFEVKKWFIIKGAARQGPFSIVELQAMIARTEVGPADHVWCEGMAAAKLMSQIDELKFLAEQPSIRRGTAHQPNLEEEAERTMVAGSAAPRRLGPAPRTPPPPPAADQDPENEPTQVMSRPARVSVTRAPGSAKPAPAAPPRSEPEDVRSLELDQPGAPPQKSPKPAPTASAPRPPVLPPPEPQSLMEEPAVEAASEPQDYESLQETAAEAAGTAPITFTNPFVRAGTGTYKKKKKKIPLQFLVGSAAGGVVLLIGTFFYQMTQAPGTPSKDIAELVATSFDLDNALTDTQPQEHAELVFAHTARITPETVKVAVARSTNTDSTLKFYLATNLPPKTRLIVSLEPFRGTAGPVFIRRIEIENSRLTQIDSGIPVKKVHPGEYYFFAVEDVDQIPEAAGWIQRMRTTPRRIPSVRELKKLVISKRYTF